MLKNILNRRNNKHKTSNAQVSSTTAKDAIVEKSTQNMPKQVLKQKSNSVTIVGHDSTVNGTIISEGSVEILGTMQGKIESHSVTIRETGIFGGELKSQHLFVQGYMDGTVNTDSLVVFSKGIAKGIISYKKIKIEDGGHVGGKLNPSSIDTNTSLKDIENEKHMPEAVFHPMTKESGSKIS